MRSPVLAVIYAHGDGVANSGLRRCLVNALSMGYFKVWPGSLRLVELRVLELRGLEPLSPCLQSMAKTSSTVCGLARSALGVHRSTATSRRAGVGCGCQRGHAIHLTQCRRGPLPAGTPGAGCQPGPGPSYDRCSAVLFRRCFRWYLSARDQSVAVLELPDCGTMGDECWELAMEDAAVPEGPGREHAATEARTAVPAMPIIGSSERDTAGPYPLLDGISPTIGWQFQRQADRGPAFVIIRRGALGALKVVESFPLTENGWAKAWQSLVTQNPAAVPKVLAKLRARQTEAARLSDSREANELDAQSLVSLRAVAYLGGYVSATGIYAGEWYDVRFLEDQLLVFPPRQTEILAQVPYREIEDVEIGGPGLVKAGGGFVGGGFGVEGAVEGMAIAAVLNALTTRTSIKTVMRIQATHCELFLLHTQATPEQLRITLSRPLGAIRSARAAANAGTGQHPVAAAPASPVEELTKLAGLLESGLLTREEFELMKAKLLGRQT
jgi:putative oligomerization/nucleic acid binding protein